MLGELPTPVQRLDRLEEALGADAPSVYIKRDDLSGGLYGGNKVRKLEFLLGRALREGYREVLTFGAAGSNHALATALYAHQLGLHCIAMLVPQPNARNVRRNLLMGYRVGAELHHQSGMVLTGFATLGQLFRHGFRERQFPFLIPPGGSSPTGLVGFVNAALELKEQIETGVLPEPDYIYAPSGTMGTVIGLLLGLKAAGLRAHVVAVRVTDPRFTSIPKAQRFFRSTNDLLCKLDPTFPRIAFPASEFEFRHEFYGQEYALYTPEGMRAVRMLQTAENIKLEGAYTGKTLAALAADTAAGRLSGKTVLFWNTYNSQDFSEKVADMDYRALPRPFHHYFEEDVQPLDR
jgi:D-cysteine desulfhydrase